MINILKWREITGHNGRHMIYEIDSCLTSKMPKRFWDRSLGKESKSDFDNMAMTSFNHAILFMSMGTGQPMNYTKTLRNVYLIYDVLRSSQFEQILI